MPRNEKIDYRPSGVADEYLDAEGHKRPVKTNLPAFLAFFLLSLLGVALIVSQVRGSWLLQVIGAVLALVGLVGTTPYKWRTQYWDLLVIIVSAVSLLIHLKASISGS